MKNVDTGERFLYELYKKADIGMGYLKDDCNPINKIEKYLKRLNETTNNAFEAKLDSVALEFLKELYYEKYVIKEEDISESYFELQKKIALERGYGHKEYTDTLKHDESMIIIDEQKKSLVNILDYLSSKDAMYPVWAKVWVFQGIMRIGKFDKETMKFTKRTKETVVPFIDVNKEVLALAIDYIVKNMGESYLTDDDIINKLIESGSFQKLYEALFKESLNKKNNFDSNVTEGIWIKYNQGSDHMPLVESLKGKSTGWCTAGELTAKEQLSNGDFFVYYTSDETGEYNNPRVAIRMEDEKIAEIRGIKGNHQELEIILYNVLDEKLNEFGQYEKNKYIKRIDNMKKLTKLYNNLSEELLVDDLVFIYQLESAIEGFGYNQDPRIEEIVEKRDILADYIYILDNCSELKKVSYFSKFKLGDLKSIKSLKIPSGYNDFLDLHSLITAEGVILSEGFNKNIDLRSLPTAKGLVLPKNYNGNIILTALITAKDLILPEGYNGTLILTNLTNAKDLLLPKGYSGDLNLNGILTAKDLVLPEGYNGNLELNGLTTAADLLLPKGYNGCLELRGMTTAKGLVLPEGYNGALSLGYLENLKDLVLPEGFGGFLQLSSATTKGLALPNSFQSSVIYYNGKRLTNEEFKKLVKRENVELSKEKNKEVNIQR